MHSPTQLSLRHALADVASPPIALEHLEWIDPVGLRAALYRTAL
jgi:hypothetical protein